MTIDWTAFTPWSAVAGGLIIGLAATPFERARVRAAARTGGAVAGAHG
jgi:hypothetical protein